MDAQLDRVEAGLDAYDARLSIARTLVERMEETLSRLERREHRDESRPVPAGG